MVSIHKQADSFWITNISDKNVSLTDLNLTVAAKRSINLLDIKHYSFTKQELLDSANSGSIFKKSDKIKVRNVPPIYPSKYLLLIPDSSANFPSKKRSMVEIEEVKYEELELSDDKFAEENADMAETDHLGKWNK